jgi:hypothetical protein
MSLATFSHFEIKCAQGAWSIRDLGPMQPVQIERLLTPPWFVWQSQGFTEGGHCTKMSKNRPMLRCPRTARTAGLTADRSARTIT